jgi:hypothetical protein
MKLTGESKGLALVLDTAPLKARRWSRLKVSPARCAAEGLLGASPSCFGYPLPYGSYTPPFHPLAPMPSRGLALAAAPVKRKPLMCRAMGTTPSPAAGPRRLGDARAGTRRQARGALQPPNRRTDRVQVVPITDTTTVSATLPTSARMEVPPELC